MVPLSGSDRAQSDALCDELCQQIARLDEGSAKLIAMLEKLERRGAQSSFQADRLQRRIREISAERFHITAMLRALGHGFPCGHERTNPPPESADER